MVKTSHPAEMDGEMNESACVFQFSVVNHAFEIWSFVL